jgi:hypothetical protein
MFFRLTTLELGLIVFGVIFAATGVGLLLGRHHRVKVETLREPFGVLQGALLGVVGLVLAFGLALAVGRYEDRRAAVVDEANAIGTTYLRAQTLPEPYRTQSLTALRRYTDAAIDLSSAIPQSADATAIIARESALQRRLWAIAGRVLVAAPVATAPRLYVDALNGMIDMQTVRVSGLNNRVPGPVLFIEVLSSAVALALLGFYLAILGRGLATVLTVLLAAAVVSALLLVTFDLDRPTRGEITVPPTPLIDVRASMSLPPAATGPKLP